MEKRFRRVQRWLERCIEACRKEKWPSAVADVECARAELEAARKELWSAVSEAGGAGEARRLGRGLPLVARSAVLAVAVIMAAALPLSTSNVFMTLEQETSGVSLEWVTPDEKSLLLALRESLSEMNSVRNELGSSPGQVPAAKPDRRVARDTAASMTESPVQKEQGKPEGPPSEKAEVTLDEILSLYEIGQRALQWESVVIKETDR
ncbi:MAG: hypothetical protein ACP5CD_02150 [Thermovirgaceae bacterium]